MARISSASIAILLTLLPALALAAQAHKRHVPHWHGYGFLPGYRPSIAESQNIPILGPPIRRREPRYINLYTGQVQYGWGHPGYFRGQWNGGSFGPCWTYTPIGMMPNCN